MRCSPWNPDIISTFPLVSALTRRCLCRLTEESEKLKLLGDGFRKMLRIQYHAWLDNPLNSCVSPGGF